MSMDEYKQGSHACFNNTGTELLPKVIKPGRTETSKETIDYSNNNMSLMKIALMACLLVLVRGDVPSCCPENKSPSGGPSNNPNAVVCKFERSSLSLKCEKGSSSHTCKVVKATGKTEADQKGPTPYGEYLIGNYHTSTTYSGLDWYKLYPKKEDNSGYYGYWSANNLGRSTMGLHPGRVSWGCVTVDASNCNSGGYDCYNRDSCWTQIKSIVSSGSMTYRKSTYSGILYVV
ncbi:uncharacterized protein LOC116618446 isoform X1 [Nematostella vectensis]|uniref:uncharacterized protein LOC116618446 isoform X1 n=2 Tax=Nematostella vectensis TaxID=45351 RepID=UPI00207740B7|nr:uncharacterized protein LOC116618446 isoform X1 [Nematostella vectensis]